MYSNALSTAWEESLANLRDSHDLTLSHPPPLPQSHYISLDASTSTSTPAPSTTDPTPDPTGPSSKRKASTTTAAAAKKAKLAAGAAAAAEAVAADEEMKKAGGFKSVLKAEDLRAPKLLNKEEMEKLIVAVQKAALLAEYGA